MKENGWGARITIAVTNSIKLAGLFLALHTAVEAHPSTVVLALAGFMMAGAQFGEETILTLASRWLGAPVKKDEAHSDNTKDQA